MSSKQFPQTYGLVACGGNSSRMGTDKSMLIYRQKPQRCHVYDMLLPFCEKVFISCKETQAAKVETGYDILTDEPAYDNIGPMAALLTVFTKFPGKNILFIGCDYPFFSQHDLQHLSAHCKDEYEAVAFYNNKEDLYEPLLAWYNCRSLHRLKKMFDSRQYSLQHFLKRTEAVKVYPISERSIKSVDTPEGRSVITDT